MYHTTSGSGVCMQHCLKQQYEACCFLAKEIDTYFYYLPFFSLFKKEYSYGLRLGKIFMLFSPVYVFSKDSTTLMHMQKCMLYIFTFFIQNSVPATSCTAFTSVHIPPDLSSSHIQNVILTQITSSQLFLITVISEITANYDILKGIH